MTTVHRKKRIILCSDGTGNIVVKNRGTNVWKTFEAVDVNGHRVPTCPDDRTVQIAYYDDGLGTENAKLIKMLGGAFGWGLGRNVRKLYTMLCRVYQPGDDIFLFGFSRGAHTVRTLTGLICRCGVIRDRDEHDGRLTDVELKVLVDGAYKAFRRHFRLSRKDIEHKSAKFHTATDATERIRKDHGHEHEVLAKDGRVPIRFLGVWDTVAAVGLPFKELTLFWNRFVHPFRFATSELHPLVKQCCHAIAIDDERETFHPELLDEEHEEKETAHKRIEQVWFAGVHSNVGGGYPKQGMSLVPLDWIMTKAEEAGLRFIPEQRTLFRDLKNVHDKKYDSRSGPKTFYRYKPRDIAEICDAANATPRIHSSVLERIAYATENYAPGNLPAQFEIVPEPTEPADRIESLRTMFGGTFGEAEGPSRRASLIGQHFPEISRWINVRRYLHVCLLVAVIALAAVGGFFAFRILKGEPSAELLAASVTFAIVAGGVFLLLALVYVIGTIARRQQAFIFSNFWNRSFCLSWFDD